MLTKSTTFRSLSTFNNLLSAVTRPVPSTPQAGFDLAKIDITYSHPSKLDSSQKERPGAISSSQLSYHWETAEPSFGQLRRADAFFAEQPPSLLFSASKFRQVERSDAPEVAFLGRSNVGKSSLLNALLGKDICHTSNKPGRTKTMNAFAVGGKDGNSPRRLVVLDMPGYGKGSREDWGTEITKYLTGRKQLKRVFVLVDSLHGLKTSDRWLLMLLRQNAVSHQVILSKVDRIARQGVNTLQGKSPSYTNKVRNLLEEMRSEVQPKNSDGPVALGEIISCCGSKTGKARKLGIDSVRWAVLVATGLDQVNRSWKNDTAVIYEPEDALEPTKSANLAARNLTRPPAARRSGDHNKLRVAKTASARAVTKRLLSTYRSTDLLP